MLSVAIQKENLQLNLIALQEEGLGAAQLYLVIVFIDPGSQPELLQRTSWMLLSCIPRSLLLLVLVAAVVCQACSISAKMSVFL